MTAYGDRVTRATQQVLLEVFQLLEKFHGSLILIGGWVALMVVLRHVTSVTYPSSPVSRWM